VFYFCWVVLVLHFPRWGLLWVFVSSSPPSYHPPLSPCRPSFPSPSRLRSCTFFHGYTGYEKVGRAFSAFCCFFFLLLLLLLCCCSSFASLLCGPVTVVVVAAVVKEIPLSFSICVCVCVDRLLVGVFSLFPFFLCAVVLCGVYVYVRVCTCVSLPSLL
jgi:hypothetical protein